jgi:hypothetical protein
VSIGASEVFGLAKDLGKASTQVAKALYDVYAEEGDAFADDWRANAVETSGEHGKHYPASITSETRVALGIEVEIGPDSSMKQGSMGRGFEFGSVNQPPHLDGLRAMPIAEVRLMRKADAVIGFLIP